MFRKYDKDRSGYIDYNEFKSMWLRLSNVRGELEARNIEIPKYATQWKLQQMLEEIVDEEERIERLAMEEAHWWYEWQTELQRRINLGEMALARAQDELSRALDAAGQVYLLGVGKSQRFRGTPHQHTTGFYGEHVIEKLWSERVHPAYEKSQERRAKKGHLVTQVPVKDILVKPRTQSPQKKPIPKSYPRSGMVRRRNKSTKRVPGKINKLTFPPKKILPVEPCAADNDSSNVRQTPLPKDKFSNQLLFEDKECGRSTRFATMRPETNTVWLCH